MTGIKVRLSQTGSAFGRVMLVAYSTFFLVFSFSARAEISYWSPQREVPVQSGKPTLLGTEKPKKNKKDPDPAYSAFLHGEYLTALEEAEKAAKKGQPEAFTLIAYLHENGLGVARDPKIAFKWYSKGAAKGDVNAIFAKAVMLAKGRGTKQNMREAAVLFDRAARKGHAAAQYNLALVYINGLVVEENLSEAIKWLKKSANQRNFQAEYDLGTLYTLGKGVKRDKKKAEYWISKAAKGGLINAELEYAVMLFNRYRQQKKHILKTVNQLKSIGQLKKIMQLPKQKRWEVIKKRAGKKRMAMIAALPAKKKKSALHYLRETPASLLSAIPLPLVQLSKKERQEAIRGQLQLLAKIKAKEDKLFPQAFQYLYSAAQKGNPIAQNRLARLYAYGHTPTTKATASFDKAKGAIRQNFITASKWHLLAKTRGISDAKLDLVFSRLSPKEKRKVYQSVDDWENLTILN